MKSISDIERELQIKTYELNAKSIKEIRIQRFIIWSINLI